MTKIDNLGPHDNPVRTISSETNRLVQQSRGARTLGLPDIDTNVDNLASFGLGTRFDVQR